MLAHPPPLNQVSEILIEFLDYSVKQLREIWTWAKANPDKAAKAFAIGMAFTTNGDWSGLLDLHHLFA